jgi:probable F420-dependent oxidoreductase
MRAMKLSVEFPSVSYRQGPEGVRRLARAIEEIGYDHIDVFDHVVMGYPIAGRPPGPYPASMPILEALMTLSYVAAVTARVTLGTEVLVLPQRQPTLVAKQVSTVDTLSGGRVRLGVGVGWQESEYDALGESFRTRGARMDEAIRLLRACWGDGQVDVAGPHYRLTAMGMEPKPPQGRQLPIWIGGMSEPAYRRVGELGDGWLASRVSDGDSARRAFESIGRHAEAAGRDARTIGLQSMVAPPPRDAEGKRFYGDHDRVVRRVAEIKAMGFGWAAINATAIFQAGARSVDAMIDALGTLHGKIRAEVG